MLGVAFSTEGAEKLQRFLAQAVYRNIILNTLILGAVVGVLGTALGFLFAFVQVKVNVPFKRFIHIMALVPVISPPFALATAVLILFGRNGMISKSIFGVRADIHGLGGLSFVLMLSLFTVSYLNLRGMMESLDPALDEAAVNLGASRWRVFRTVTLPMLLPGILGSFLLLFVEAIADLGNPLVLGGDFEVLATRIYVSVVGLYDTTAAAVFSIVLLLPSLIVFLVQRYWVSRASVVSVSGKPSGTPYLITNSWVRWLLFGLVMFFCLLIILIYATIIVGAFTRVIGVNNSFTLGNFEFVLTGYGSKAMVDTTLFSVIATPIAGLLGMIIAFIVVRTVFPGRNVLDFATMLGIAVPGTIVGIGFLLAFNTPTQIALPFFTGADGQPFYFTLIPKLTGGRALFGGALAIVLVYIVRSVPAALRSGVSALSQIDPSIEEASVSLGADNAQTFRKITLPLIRPAFLSGLIYAFARSMTTISAIVFLTTPQTRIMTQQILNETENGRYGNAFAYCVILIGIVLVAIGSMYFIVGAAFGANRPTQGGAQ
ncbi:MAG: iron ABC transporter permease [Anaerolineae bacterium]|nr:iron ABC transporter permease [Anaerolineae bacterium]